MFVLACQKLAIKPSELLHVGDCGRADIQGALLAGCQAAWLSCYDVGKPITELPHIDLNELSHLERLLPR
jgi:putative hydrolase of the HAD superfamily